MGGREIVWVVSEKRRPVAALLGVEFGRGPVVRFQAMPDGCYSAICPLTDEPLDMTLVANTLLDGLYRYGYVKIYLNDYFHEFPASQHFTCQQQETLLIDISDPDWQPPDKTLQSEIRKAQREDVAIEKFSAHGHMPSFLHLMHATEKRHGREPKYSDAFFEELAALAHSDPRVRWFQIMNGDQAAASHIFLVDRNMALHWQVYFDKTHSSLKPNQLLLYTVAKQLASEGVRTLNLGSSSGADESLLHYKGKWGGVPHRYITWQHVAGLGKLL